MIRKTIILILTTLLSVHFHASAQESDAKAINTIKRNPAYFFSESTMAVPAEARESACLSLISYINDALDQVSPGRKVTPKELAAIKYLTAKRGTNTRVLAYIEKSMFGLGEAPAPQPQPAPQPEPQPAPTPTPEPRPAPQPEPTPAPAPAPVKESRQTVSKADAANDIIDELLEATTFDGIRNLLQVYKAAHKISGYGTPRECRDASRCYWIVCNTDFKPVALLGPGAADRRHNYKSGATEGLADYPGMIAVWFAID